MPSYKGVVVVKAQGQTVPDKFIENAMLHNDSCIGAVRALKDKEGKPILQVIHSPWKSIKDPMDMIMKAQKAFEKDKMVFFFGKYPEGFSDKDIQPYSMLVNDDGKTVMAAFLVGEVEESGDETDGMSSQYVEVDSYLTPKLLKLYEGVEYDLHKLDEEMRKKPFRRELEGYFPKASLTTVSAIDAVLTFSQASPGHRYEWGWASDSLGYTNGEKPAEAPAKEPDNIFEIGDTPAIQATEPTPKPEAKRPPIASTLPISKRPDPKVVTAAASGKKPAAEVTHPPGGTPVDKGTAATEMRAPPKGWSNKAIKRWYNQHIGRVPDNWKDCPPVPVKVTTFKGKIDEETGNGLKEQLKGSTASVPKVAPKATAPAPASKPQPAGEPQPVETHDEPVVPIIPAAKKKDFLDNFMKNKQVALLGRDKESILTLDFKTFMSESPSYHELAGVPNLEAAINQLQSKEDRFELITKHPEHAEQLMADLMFTLVKNWHADVKTETGEAPAKPAAASGGGAKRSLPPQRKAG